MASYAAITAMGQPVYAADLEAELEQQQQQQQQQQPHSQNPDEAEAEESEHFLDSLDEVHTRFILNVPHEELSTSERIFFQLEQAWWYYEDLICDKLEEETGVCHLPRFANLKPFSKRLFEFSPLLRHLDFFQLWKEFAIYKRKISTYGCILLNQDCTHVVLCKLYKSNTWTFPAGKINQNEIGIEAASREVYEETGFDPHCVLGGLTKEWLDQDQTDHLTWNRPLQDPEDALTFVEQPSGKRRTCYVCCGVPEDFPFEPVCRKEVDQIEWIELKDIKDYKTFAVMPFVKKLKKWIKQRQTNSHKKKKGNRKNKSRPKSRGNSRPSSRPKSSGRDHSTKKERRSSKSLIHSGLIASMGDSTRWTEEEMFATNSKLQGGRIVAYDGNPHAFAEQGFGVDDEATGSQRIDPHSFRVVGGSFMNSTHGDKLAETSNRNQIQANYQPLVTDGGGVSTSKLQPFFSQHGVTPWGETVDEAKSDEGDFETMLKDDSEFDGHDSFAMESPNGSRNHSKKTKNKKASAGHDLLAMLQQQGDATKSSTKPGPVSGDYNYDDDAGMMIFATDKEITAKKQRDYELQKNKKETKGSSRREAERLRKKKAMMAQCEADMAFVHEWVKSLPNPVNFQIPNVDAIIDQHYGKGAAQQAAAAAAAR